MDLPRDTPLFALRSDLITAGHGHKTTHFLRARDPLSPGFHQPAFFWPRVHSVCSKPEVSCHYCLMPLDGKSGRIFPVPGSHRVYSFPAHGVLLPPRVCQLQAYDTPPLTSLLHHNFSLLCVFWTVVSFGQPDLICFLLSQIPTTHVLNYLVLFYTSQQ